MLNLADLKRLAQTQSAAEEAVQSASGMVRQYDRLATHFGEFLRKSAYEMMIEREMERLAEVERMLRPYREMERLCGFTAADQIQAALLETAALERVAAQHGVSEFADSVLQFPSTARMGADVTGNMVRWNTAIGPPSSIGVARALEAMRSEVARTEAWQAALGVSDWSGTFFGLNGADRAAWATISSVANIRLGTSIASAIGQSVAQRRALEQAMLGYVEPYQSSWQALEQQAWIDALGIGTAWEPIPGAPQPSKKERSRKVPPPNLDSSHTDFIDNCRIYEAVQIAAPAAEGVLRLEFHKQLSPSDSIGENWVEQLLPAARLEELRRIQEDWVKKGYQVPLYRCMSLGDIASLVHEKRVWKFVRALFSKDRKAVFAALVRISEPRNLGAHAGCGLTEDVARRALEDIRQFAVDLGSDFLLEKVDEVSARLDGVSKHTLH
jgi:hypothetical protein